MYRWKRFPAIIGTILAILLLLALSALPNVYCEEPTKESLVELRTVNPNIIVDLKYATPDNFLKEAVYTDNRCFVLESLARKLDQAQKNLMKDGLGLKVYDGFRPLSVQRKMWAILPDSRYVANPNKNGSMHNRGAAVDLTLVDSAGKELEMPTAFDAFTERAHQYSLLPTPQQRANRLLLRQMMKEVGLVGITTEWWHFQLSDAARHPIVEEMPK